ncbi:NERD domain-containing protein [Mucilaginibacter sp. UR6-1]|uniref:nuclease-related domain-containing protein n=1 Tax=Mucilaginibacter sp. UR6-1 TaxID=1435643 RepID=UPI001E5E5C57|nr:NERD domain-containing protein [Mucilaginibacter sp. UR6-1]MCC8410888.1 NERD domain-containing protein [Mucilaginibacter sp. UR6-1]
MKGLLGWIGEKKTTFHLWLNLDSCIYKKIHNVIVPAHNGTAQIDHLIVSPFGLFIVETKNLKGWIFGSVSQPRWTQVIFGYKYHFQNPIHQTFRQKKVLSEYLKINEMMIHTLIYFNGDCKFKTLLPSNVINKDLAKCIKREQEVALNEADIISVLYKVKELKHNSSLTAKNHIRGLLDRYSSVTTCPKCGSDLVERNATKSYGRSSKFLGCANYPKCRFTKKV